MLGLQNKEVAKKLIDIIRTSTLRPYSAGKKLNALIKKHPEVLKYLEMMAK